MFFLVPLENTCFIKTVVKGSWEEARQQCWDWGGELAFPLLSNKTTPKSWMQDDEEVSWNHDSIYNNALPI